MTRCAARPIALILALAVVATGCSAPREQKPEAWATSVCHDAVPPLSKAAAEIRRAAEPLARHDSPAKAKGEMITAVKAALAATDKALKALDDAGEPDVKDGATIAKTFRGVISRSRAGLVKAEKSLRALATSDQTKFDVDVTRVFNQLAADYRTAGQLDNKLKSPALEKAFKTVPACKRS